MNMPDPQTFGKQAEKAFQEAVRNAIERHRRLGFPIAVKQNGKVVILEPADIPPLAAAPPPPPRSGSTGE